MKYKKLINRTPDQESKEEIDYKAEIAKADADKELAEIKLEVTTKAKELDEAKRAFPFSLSNVVKLEERLEILKKRYIRAKDVVADNFTEEPPHEVGGQE